MPVALISRMVRPRLRIAQIQGLSVSILARTGSGLYPLDMSDVCANQPADDFGGVVELASAIVAGWKQIMNTSYLNKSEPGLPRRGGPALWDMLSG